MIANDYKVFSFNQKLKLEIFEIKNQQTNKNQSNSTINFICTQYYYKTHKLKNKSSCVH